MLRSVPDVAAALRSRIERIMQSWSAEVEKYLPHADPLTTRQVRNSIPNVIEKIALALETANPEAITVLNEVSRAHGVARFQQGYNIEEVVIEYRLLRRVVFDELYRGIGYQLSFMDAVPVDMGVDTAMHRGVVTYVRHLSAELKSAAEAEAKFLAFLSHDLRNNLNAASLRLEVLRRRLEREAQFAEDVRDIQALQSSLHQTISGMNRLLQAERLRRQTVTLQLGEVDLHQLAAEQIEKVTAEARGKGLNLENAVPAGAMAQSDRELILLAIQNLLGNAVKYSTRGTIRIQARDEPRGWRLSITDEGPGIAPERVNTLFQAFTRGETHGQPGVGLGLTIASHAARLLGSELSVESKLGEGSTFSFIVPAADAAERK